MDLVREGEQSDHLYVITQGWACRYKTTYSGSRQIVALLLPGDVANLDALTVARSGYDVRVLAAGNVAAIPRERAMALAVEHAGVAKILMQLALGENAILSQWAMCLGRQCARKRLAHLLCEVAVRLCGDEEASTSFELPMTQEQLGDALGLTSVHVNQTIQRLRSEGLIVTGGHSVTLPDVPALRRMAEFDPVYLQVGTAGFSGRDGGGWDSSSPGPAF